MKIQNFLHKGLKRLYEQDSAKGVPAECANKLRNMLGFLQDMGDAEELPALSLWKAHRLTGNRAGTWSLHVTKNWRLTFKVDAAKGAITDVDFEDYH